MPEPRRRRSWRRRRGSEYGPGARLPWLWALLGSLTAVVGVAVLAGTPETWGNRAPYARAVPCPPVDAGAATRDCVRDVPATVTDTYVRRRRLDDYYVLLRVHDGVRRTADPRVELPDPEPVFDRLGPGTPVVARLWGDDVARIELPGVGAVETEDSPLVASVEQVLLGLFALVWGLTGVRLGVGFRRAGGGWFRRAPDYAAVDADGAWGVTARVGLAGMAGTGVTFFQVVAFDVYDPLPVALTGAACVAAVLALFRFRRPVG